MKRPLIKIIAVALLGTAAAAHADPMISYRIYDGTVGSGALIGSGSDFGMGFVTLSGIDLTFFVSGSAVGVAAPLPDSAFQTTVGTVLQRTKAAGTISVELTQTGLTGPLPGGITSTFTANAQTGGDFSFLTITNYFDSGDVAFGTETVLGTYSYSGHGSDAATTFQSSLPASNAFSETVLYTVTFGSGRSGSISASSQMIDPPAFGAPPPADSVDVPEPMSLALLGIGLFGLGVTRRRKTA